MVKLVFIFQGSVRKDKARIDLVISVFCAHVLQTELSMKKVYNFWGRGSQTFNAKCVCLHAQSIERKRSSVYNNTMNGSCYDRTIL